VDIHGHEFVRAVTYAFHSEGPDVDVILLTVDELGNVRGVAGLVSACRVDKYRTA
jgi:hypothetical protein